DQRGIATLTLDRSQKHNALSQQMIDELLQAAMMLGGDPDVRVVILTGAGESFCAGGDLNWMRDQINADDAARMRAAKSIAMMLKALNTLPKPLIGRLQAGAFGGGIGLACICDVAIADKTARFGLTETRLGLIPATIGPYVLARMGEANARRVFMSSRVFGAAEAQELRIITRAVPAGELDRAIEAEIAPYLDCSPNAVAAAKKLARSLGPTIDEAVINASIDALIARWNSDDAAEGISAFLEKRRPSWAT
ncbi:MAG: crotonase/enoyl-CoA hydratase family protein, partial [Paracoccaceae bacterium]